MGIMFADEKFGKDIVGSPTVGERILEGDKIAITRGRRTFFAAITDSNYYDAGKGFGGHPEDSPRETFASIFFANVVFPEKFALYASTDQTNNNTVAGPLIPRPLSPDIGRVLKEMAAITLEKEK
jgi:hypothetical protein